MSLSFWNTDLDPIDLLPDDWDIKKEWNLFAKEEAETNDFQKSSETETVPPKFIIRIPGTLVAPKVEEKVAVAQEPKKKIKSSWNLKKEEEKTEQEIEAYISELKAEIKNAEKKKAEFESITDPALKRRKLNAKYAETSRKQKKVKSLEDILYVRQIEAANEKLLKENADLLNQNFVLLKENTQLKTKITDLETTAQSDEFGVDVQTSILIRYASPKSSPYKTQPVNVNETFSSKVRRELF